VRGFGKQQQTESKDYKSICRQIEFLVVAMSKGQLTDNVPIFTTSLKRKRILSQAVHALAQKHPSCHLQVMSLDEDTPGTMIVPHKRGVEGFSSAWVSLSPQSGKWRVMAAPPGAWECRCLTVWEEEAKAWEICESIIERVIRMPLADWRECKGEYLKLLRSLPPDDDSIIGVVDLEARELVPFDRRIQQGLLPLLNRAIAGDKDAISQLDAAIKQLRHEAV
jgi:hypothetical protein